MGVPVVIYGKSGSGKSRSLKNFGQDEIIYVNVEGKRLPFRHGFTKSMVTDDPQKIACVMARTKTTGCKVVVLDDIGLMMTHMFMARHRNKKGNESFEMYDDIADAFYGLFTYAQKDLPDDVIVYFLLHEDTDDSGSTKIKTIGRLLDGKCQIAERITIALRCMSDNGQHFFRTVTDGSDITKSPE